MRHEKAYRCRTCKHVFYITEGVTSKPVGTVTSEEPVEEETHATGEDARRQQRRRRRNRVKGFSRRRLVEIGAFIAMMFVFYFVMRYFLQERAASEPSSSIAPLSHARIIEG